MSATRGGGIEFFYAIGLVFQTSIISFVPTPLSYLNIGSRSKRDLFRDKESTNKIKKLSADFKQLFPLRITNFQTGRFPLSTSNVFQTEEGFFELLKFTDKVYISSSFSIPHVTTPPLRTLNRQSL